jgi:hypothetical protein
MCDLPPGFHRAEQDYLYNTPENSKDYDDWCDGREELDDSLTKYFKTLESIDIEPSNAKEARESYEKLVSVMCDLRRLVTRIEELEDEFPPEYEETEPDYDSMPGGHDWIEPY